MFRDVAIGLALLFSTTSMILVNVPKAVSPEQKIVYHSKNHVKKIMSVLGGHCSSVFVKHDGKIRHITNAHCCTIPMLYGKDVVEFGRIDVNNDLCELKHKNMTKDGILLSQKTAELTDIIYTVGFPGYYDLTISQGRIVTRAVPSTLSDQYVIRTSAFTIGGSSGGAALNADGDLIGIVSQGNGIPHGSFVPLYVLREFLNK
jgi:hypothetical protein